MKRGKLIAFEGVDRAGKTSVISALPAALRGCTVEVTVCGELRSPIAPIIRGMLDASASPFLKTYFFAADRAWTYERECLPALDRGSLVLWDRYVDSAIIYRGVESRRYPEASDPTLVRDINRPFIPPDLTIILAISADVSAQRAMASAAREPYDTAFLTEVMEAYDALTGLPGYATVRSDRALGEVTEAAVSTIRTAFPELFR